MNKIINKELAFNGKRVRVQLDPRTGIWVAIHDVATALRRPSYMLTNPVFTMCPTACKIIFEANRNSMWGAHPADLVPYFKSVSSDNARAYKLYNELVEWLNKLSPETLCVAACTENNDTDDSCTLVKNDIQEAQDVLRVFSHPDFGDVRTVAVNGEPMFCLADICKALGLTNPSTVKIRLEQEDTQLIDLRTLNFTEGRNFINPMVTFINESAFYDVILHSNAASAKPFRKWVTSEVLPSIRKTGAYVAATPDDDPETIIARGLIAAKEALERMEQRALQAEGSYRIAKPKAEYYDAVIGERDVFTTSQLAGELNISYPTLRKLLFENEVITSRCGIISLTPRYEEWAITTCNSPRNSCKRIKWTKSGRKGIFALLAPQIPA